jgi:23S rRNA pseudouridine2605 synthase
MPTNDRNFANLAHLGLGNEIMKKDFNKKPGPGRPRKDDGKPSRDGDRKPYNRDASDRPKRRDDDDGGRKRSSDRDERPKRSFDNDRPKRSFDSDKPKRSFDKRDGDDRPKRSFDNDRPKRSFDKRDGDDRPKRPYDNDKPKRSFDKRDGDDRPKRPYDNDRPKRSFDKRDGDDRPKRPYDSDKPKRSFDKRDGDDRPKRSFDKRDGDDRPKRPYDNDKPKRSFDKRDGDDRPKRSFDKKDGDREERPKRAFDKKGGKPAPDKDKGKPKKKRTFGDVMNDAFNNRDPLKEKERELEKEQEQKENRAAKQREEKEEAPAETKKRTQTSFDRSVSKIRTTRGTDMDAYVEKKLEKADKPTKKRKTKDDEEDDEIEFIDNNDVMPVNKYIAHSGECSRREAAELVKQGKVKVNGELVTDPGQKVTREDQVTVAGKKMTLQKDHVYILLNKPKGFITTTDDPEGRKTVMDLVANSGADRVFPVGRLDRNTTGLLLLTNDGALAQKLSHPSYSIKKVYQVTLDKQVTKAHFEQIAEGIELEDGPASVDEIAYLENKNEIGLEIHLGRNRIVRRIFESLGYEVEKLDRVMYAGLTKKNLSRGEWRYLTEKELILLKHFKS